MRQTLALGASKSRSPTLKACKEGPSLQRPKPLRALRALRGFSPLQRRSFFFELLEWGTSFLRLQELRFASESSESSQRLQPSSKEVLLFQAFRVGDQLSEAPGAKVCLIEL